MKDSYSRSPIRVALITQGFFIGGGVPAVARWLADGLRATGRFDVEVIDLATSARDARSRRIMSPGTWARRSLRGAARNGIEQWGANAVEIEAMRYRPRRELSSFLGGYDLVQVVGGSPAIANAATKSGLPIVIQTATTVRWERESQMADQSGVRRSWRVLMTRLTTRAEKRGLKSASGVMVENDDMYQFTRSVGQHKVYKAPPGIDTDKFSPGVSGRARRGYFLSVCRLGDARKGLDRTVRAYAELRSERPDLPQLILAGRGSLPPKIEALIDELGLRASIEVRSDVPLEELPDLFRGASVFLQTSHEEGLGISVLEAMASGLPVVATETAGSRETVLDGETGYLIPQDLDEELIVSFAKAALKVFDDGDGMGARAASRAQEQFSVDVTLNRFIRLYDEILRSRNAEVGRFVGGDKLS